MWIITSMDFNCLHTDGWSEKWTDRWTGHQYILVQFDQRHINVITISVSDHIPTLKVK